MARFRGIYVRKDRSLPASENCEEKKNEAFSVAKGELKHAQSMKTLSRR